MKKIHAAALGLSVLLSTPALAHISVWPQQSTVGVIEKYTLRVPTEGKLNAIGVELDVPEGVEFGVVASPVNYKYEVKKVDGKITNVVWTINVPPGEFIELSFLARNPGGTAKEIVWPTRVRLSDGSVVDMLKDKQGNIRKPVVVKLNPLPAE